MLTNLSRILAGFFLFLSFSLWAGGPILIDAESTGQAVLWQNGVVRYNLEDSSSATLGSLSNVEAVALVRDLFNEWKNVTINGVSTVSLTFQEGAGLGSVNASNLNDHFSYCPDGQTCPSESAPFILGSARTGASPILFDEDGSMTDKIHGQGSSKSILGFAGPRVVERTNGILYITEGQALLNGKFINGVTSSSDPEVTVTQFKGAIIHELGHFMGVDHTQVNLSSVVKHLNGDKSEKSGIPTMLPLFVDGDEQLSLHFDDKVTISTLYPSSNFQSSFCTLQGKVFKVDGTTELQGVNVAAKNAANALLEVTSSVSGSFYTGSSTNCNVAKGDYLLSGLTPGTSYLLNIEAISRAFTGGSSLEPCDPPQSGFDSKTISGLFSCSSGGQVITTGTESSTMVTSTKSTASSATSEDSSGGCSLLP